MRRSTTPGKRFGAGPLNSPGPSPAIVKTPQAGIQPAHTQHGLPAPTQGKAVFNKPVNPAQIGRPLTRTARGNPTHGQAMQRSPATPVNAGRPVSGVGRGEEGPGDLRAARDEAERQAAMNRRRRKG